MYPRILSDFAAQASCFGLFLYPQLHARFEGQLSPVMLVCSEEFTPGPTYPHWSGGGGVLHSVLLCWSCGFVLFSPPLPFLCFPTQPPLCPRGQALHMCVGEASTCLLAHFRQFPVETQGSHVSDIFLQRSQSIMWLLWQPLPFS